MIRVFSVPLCGGCEQLKEYVRGLGMTPEIDNLKEIGAAEITDMRLDGLHGLEDRIQAPILQVGHHFWRFEDLFRGVGELDTEAVDRALSGAAPARFGVA